MNETAREATWLTTEEAEVQRARLEGSSISPEFFRRGKTQTLIVFVASTTLVAALIAASSNTGQVPFVLLAVAGLSLGLIPLVLHWERQQAPAREADEGLREGFGKGYGRFVTLIIRQGQAPTGEDKGMLWFEEGRLYYSGHRTSFGLVPRQARDSATMEDGVPKVRNEVNLLLDRDTAAGPMSLSFGLCLPSHENSIARHSELKHELDRWKLGKRKGEGQWPPAAIGPCVVSDRRLLAETVLWILLYPIPFAAFFLAVASWKIALVAYLVSAFILYTSQGHLRFKALRDRRRLRRLP